MADEKQAEQSGGYGSGYGKRPMWQWILLYIIIGGILYYGVYYFFMRGNGSDGSNGLYGSSSNSSGSLYNYGTK